MSKYWLCVTTEENWNIIKDKKIWAVKEKDLKKLDKVAIGDPLVFYVKQRAIEDKIFGPKIGGICMVDSKSFKDSTRVFTNPPAQEKFVYRVNIQPIIANAELDFKTIVPKLKFIKNKKKWFLSLQVAMRRIPKEDYDLITSLAPTLLKKWAVNLLEKTDRGLC